MRSAWLAAVAALVLAAGSAAAVACGAARAGSATESAAPASASVPAPSPNGGGDAGQPTLADQLLALTTTCNVASSGEYALDPGMPEVVDICSLEGAYWFYADMDVDCDGRTTVNCSSRTDPQYQARTSFTQSDGRPLVADQLPYVVVPLPSSRFDYEAAGIAPGAVVAVVYNGQLVFGVFGDEGPKGIIGEASYALAKSLGIDPDPANGGVTGTRAVTYVVFTGKDAVPVPIEDHAAAVALGTTLVKKLVGAP
jgi:hypothetical protein